MINILYDNNVSFVLALWWKPIHLYEEKTSLLTTAKVCWSCFVISKVVFSLGFLSIPHMSGDITQEGNRHNHNYPGYITSSPVASLAPGPGTSKCDPGDGERPGGWYTLQLHFDTNCAGAASYIRGQYRRDRCQWGDIEARGITRVVIIVKVMRTYIWISSYWDKIEWWITVDWMSQWRLWCGVTRATGK